jgi:general secretion pathway protein E/type IV pilus assembly protein PilB
LVFSTLHTNDAAGAYTRLVDMGVEPFLVASTVEAVMAQRLVRTLCPKCKKTFRPKREAMPRDFPWELLEAAGGQICEPVGCRECRHVGYRGRLGLYELLLTTEEVRQLAHDRASSWKIARAAIDSGMVTLRNDGWNKVLAGRTSVDEVLRNTKGEVMLRS